jgi:glucokinase
MANPEITPFIVSEAAKAGDPVAITIFRIMAEYIGIGLASVVNLLNPERIIIGGGVADAGDLLMKPLVETLKSRAMKIAGDKVEVVPAQLGNTAGVIGASLLIES